MIIDNHVHVGWFTDGYHSPKEIWGSEMAAGVDGMAVASTSTCAELYKDVCRELRELIRFGGEKVHPILWLTPRMLKLNYPLPYMLHSKIKWQGIKLHFESHPEWSKNRALLNKALDVAKLLDVPVLLHTGNFEVSHAGRFKDVIQDHSEQTFILAHGRPIEEAIDVLLSCPNTYVDTAFMPMSDLQKLVEEGLTDRILFGTDAPINKVFFKEIDTSMYIRDTINQTYKILGDKADGIFSRCIYGE